LGLPANVSNWSDHHVLIALSRRGEDLPGNLVIGRESFDRFQQLRFANQTTKDFPSLSAAALAGEHVGSSTGGERPKFTCLMEDQHRIVKFAGSETDNARRWRDLLALEHLALQMLGNAGIPAADAQLLDAGNQRYLIVNRFDRKGVRGRRSVMTLAAATERVDGSWADGAEDLVRRKKLSQSDARRIALLDAYGALIANSDRHRYNVLLFRLEDGSYTLAPAFDQLPMAYAPPASGHLRNTVVKEPVPTVNTLDVWEEAQAIARHFWRSAANKDLSDSMSEIVRAHARR